MMEIKICEYTIKRENDNFVVYELSDQKIGDNYIDYKMESFDKLSDAIEYVNTFIKKKEK